MKELPQLEGARVIVTGGGNGIGEAFARRCAAGGATVVVNDVDATAAASVAEDIHGIAVPLDLATEDGPDELVARATEALGGIDFFFANAGIDAGGGVDTDDATWARALEVNVLAHVRAARSIVPQWLASGGGTFVVTASAAGLLTMIGNAPYSITKHAAVAFAEWLSIEYGERGVHVHAVCPQGVDTRMLRRSGAVQGVLSHNAALSPDDVVDATFAGIEEGRFLVLPHPEVADYYRARALDTDGWLSGMRRLHARTFAHG